MSHEYYIAYLGKFTNMTNKTYSTWIPVKFKIKKKKNLWECRQKLQGTHKEEKCQVEIKVLTTMLIEKRQLKKREWELMILDRANIFEILK